jgi:hypothetical protein
MDTNKLALYASVTVLPLLLFRLWRKKSNIIYPPGPSRLPLIGNLRDWPKSKEWEKFGEWARQYGMSPCSITFFNVLTSCRGPGLCFLIWDTYCHHQFRRSYQQSNASQI